MKHVGSGVSGGSGKRRKRTVELVFSSSDRKLLTLLLQGQSVLLAEIGRLANSNEALVQAMAEQGEAEEGPTSPSLGFIAPGIPVQSPVL